MSNNNNNLTPGQIMDMKIRGAIMAPTYAKVNLDLQNKTNNQRQQRGNNHYTKYNAFRANGGKNWTNFKAQVNNTVNKKL